jgi:hypothetical protein
MLFVLYLRILASSRIPRYDLGRRTPHFGGGPVTEIKPSPISDGVIEIQIVYTLQGKILQYDVCTVSRTLRTATFAKSLRGQIRSSTPEIKS